MTSGTNLNLCINGGASAQQDLHNCRILLLGCHVQNTLMLYADDLKVMQTWTGDYQPARHASQAQCFQAPWLYALQQRMSHKLPYQHHKHCCQPQIQHWG